MNGMGHKKTKTEAQLSSKTLDGAEKELFSISECGKWHMLQSQFRLFCEISLLYLHYVIINPQGPFVPDRSFYTDPT